MLGSVTSQIRAPHLLREWTRSNFNGRGLVLQGFAEAHLQLGDLYHLGRRVDADPMLAHAWYEKAAAKGDPEAAARLRITASSISARCQPQTLLVAHSHHLTDYLYCGPK